MNHNKQVEKASLMRNKPYLYLISSQVVSSLGDWLDMLAIMALVALKWEASPIAMAGVGLCLLGPMAVVSPVAGILADKYDRKKLMILSDVIRCLVVIGFVFSTALWQIYTLLIIKSIFAALFIPAKNGKLKEIVPESQMQSAMAISGVVDNGSKIVGPLISGLLVSLVGIQWSFYLDAASFVLSAILLFGVPKTINETFVNDSGIPKEKETMISQLKDGLTVLRQIPFLSAGLMVFSVALLVIQIADTQLMVLLRQIDGDPTEIVGYGIAANGIGMLIMSIILSKKKIQSTAIYIGLGSAVVGLCFAGMVLLVPLSIVMTTILTPLLFFIAGLAAAAIIIPFQITAQKGTPVQYTGRVFGTISSVTTLASLIGMVSGGVIAEIFGVNMAFVLSGGLLVIVGIVVLIKRSKLESRVNLAESDRGLQGKASG
ncbi:MFS transporter [Litchfieldia salsa]|uniref:Predicted arabinose efflux permease, MFS family n=1 Tax=Litchfieldia salsa TaxID=930152 RepID=A0A1H0WPP5_9BACI|nr:MFS transporter [Litchfieldia salsa]SDP92425.1 Predicted arabinose efflux permease, MFS family [Litchfieldia salsa]